MGLHVRSYYSLQILSKYELNENLKVSFHGMCINDIKECKFHVVTQCSCFAF